MSKTREALFVSAPRPYHIVLVDLTIFLGEYSQEIKIETSREILRYTQGPTLDL